MSRTSPTVHAYITHTYRTYIHTDIHILYALLGMPLPRIPLTMLQPTSRSQFVGGLDGTRHARGSRMGGKRGDVDGDDGGLGMMEERYMFTGGFFVRRYVRHLQIASPSCIWKLRT